MNVHLLRMLEKGDSQYMVSKQTSHIFFLFAGIFMPPNGHWIYKLCHIDTIIIAMQCGEAIPIQRTMNRHSVLYTL